MEKSAPLAARTRSTSALNEAEVVSSRNTLGRSASGRSGARRTRVMRSRGSGTGSPALMARATSSPASTRPKAV